MAAPYAWEVESDSEHDVPDGGDVYACMSAEDAAAELVELLTFLKHSGKLPAIYASQIAWFASRAGAVDATLAKMGLPHWQAEWRVFTQVRQGDRHRPRDRA